MNWQKQVSDFKSGLKVEGPSLSMSYIRFGFFGSVGGGKSVTAGIFAIGITPTGLIGWIDGEGRRSGYAIATVSEMAARKYGGTAKDFEDRFKVIHIDPPFHPLRVVAAIEALEEIGCKTVIADILSQCWDSDGGYLDLKNENLDRRVANIDDDEKAEAKRKASASSAAADVKPWTHQKLVNKINASRCHMVLLFQAKQKYNAAINKPDAFVTPIQESGLTRTAVAVGRVECQMVGDKPEGGFCTFRGAIREGTKHTYPPLLEILPANGEQFTFEHAEAVARMVKREPKAAASTKAPVDKLAATLKGQLWELTASVHNRNKEHGPAALENWLREEKYITAEESLTNLPANRLSEVIANIQAR